MKNIMIKYDGDKEKIDYSREIDAYEDELTLKERISYLEEKEFNDTITDEEFAELRAYRLAEIEPEIEPEIDDFNNHI